MSKGLKMLKELKEACATHMGKMVYILQEDKFETIEKELKALDILIKWYQPYIIHDLCCLGASDKEINLVIGVLK